MVLINRENKTGPVVDIGHNLMCNLPRTEPQKSVKYENLALEVKNIWKLNNVSVHPLVISADESSPRTPKISRDYRFNQKHLKSGANSSTITNISCGTRVPKTRPLTLEDRMNILPLTEHNPTDSLGWVKVLQQTYRVFHDFRA